MTLPNFLVLGAPKCGTTSIYFHLLAHPEIFLCDKELHFFCYQGRPKQEIKITELGKYEACFERVQNEKAIGEVAISYLGNAAAVGNIHTVIPHAKLIASLRNPVDRSFSHYLMHCRTGNIRTASGRVVGAIPTPEEMFDGFSDRSAFYIDQSRYGEKLQRYYDRFSRDQIAVYTLEDLEENGIETMQSMFRFLEVDDSVLPDVSTRYNVARTTSHNRLLVRLRSSSSVMSIARTVIPKSVADSFHRSRKAQKGAGEQSSQPRAELPDEIRASLLADFEPDIRLLEDLTGQDFSPWRQGA